MAGSASLKLEVLLVQVDVLPVEGASVWERGFQLVAALLLRLGLSSLSSRVLIIASQQWRLVSLLLSWKAEMTALLLVISSWLENGTVIH